MSAAVGNRKAIDDVPAEFRYRINRYPITINFTGGPPPTEVAAQQQELQEFRSTNFEPTHPFPVPVRLGFADRDAFMRGFTWTFEVKGQNLLLTGSRHVYTCIVPITHPPSESVAALRGTLYFNFYPEGGSGLNRVVNILEDDTRFFAI